MIRRLIKERLNIYSITYNKVGQIIIVNTSNSDKDIDNVKKDLIYNYGVKINIEPTI